MQTGDRSLTLRVGQTNPARLDSESQATGKVYLVGAGPGDPELITYRGLSCLKSADIVLYDYLANPRILEACPAAECVCLGRHGRGKVWSQAEINDRLICEARAGKSV